MGARYLAQQVDRLAIGLPGFDSECVEREYRPFGEVGSSETVLVRRYACGDCDRCVN